MKYQGIFQSSSERLLFAVDTYRHWNEQLVNVQIIRDFRILSSKWNIHISIFLIRLRDNCGRQPWTVNCWEERQLTLKSLVSDTLTMLQCKSIYQKILGQTNYWFLNQLANVNWNKETNKWHMDWRDGSIVKCSFFCRGPWFCCVCPYGST